MKFFIHDSDGAKPDKYCQALAPNPKPQNPKTKKPKTKGPWADTKISCHLSGFCRGEYKARIS